MKIDGFKTSAVAAGVKYKDRLDLGLIYSEEPAVTAGVFTTNLVVAAPLLLDKERLKDGKAQAILVNSGNANACTGQQGVDVCLDIGKLLADELDVDENMVLLSSTGVIGEKLNRKPFADSMADLVKGLSADNFNNVAEAIMTTDTVRKTVETEVEIGGKPVKIMAMAKGAGMIMPNMATMLSFVLTDAQISYPELQKILTNVVGRTFNRITIDGDTSTNDMVLVMANGRADNPWIDDGNPGCLDEFTEALEFVLSDLALKIVADGEGATKIVTINVVGAIDNKDAEKVARTVANSNLVKTAFFGEDANWGRIIAAMGRSGVKFDQNNVDILFGDVVIVKNGLGQGADAENQATKLLKEEKIKVIIDLKEGSGESEIYTCDFSVDYVKINADYRS